MLLPGSLPRMVGRVAAWSLVCSSRAVRRPRPVHSAAARWFLAAGPNDRLDDFLGTLDDWEPEALPTDGTAKAASRKTEEPRWCEWEALAGSVLPSDDDDDQHPAEGWSPTEVLRVGGRRIHVKRDDLLHLKGSRVSGNKARKMWSLNHLLAEKVPPVVVSYGGPQSNSMLALAAVCRHHNASRSPSLPPVRFVYYTKTLPRFLKNQPNGNLFRAKTLGMELVEVSHQEYKALFEHEWGGRPEAPPGLVLPPPPTQGHDDPAPPESATNALWVPQGGASGMAREGARRLAAEIRGHWASQDNPRSDRPLTVVFPGGTCATAVLVHHALRELSADEDWDVEVVVVPCVGDAAYARRQMMRLSAEIGADPGDIPTVLPPHPPGAGEEDAKYFSFGAPHEEILAAFRELGDKHGLVLDLLYGAPAWAILLRHFRAAAEEEEKTQAGAAPATTLSDVAFDPNRPLAPGREILYVHSGGLEGINSQLHRYKHKGLVDIEDIQLPGRPASNQDSSPN